MNNYKKLFAIIFIGIFLNANAISLSNNGNDEFEKLNNEVMEFFSKALLNNKILLHNNPFIKNDSSIKMNLSENINSYIYEFQLAGFDKKDIQVSINDENILNINTNKKSLSKHEKENMIKQEIFYSSYSRSIALKKDANAQNIRVEYKNGILKVIVAKDLSKLNKKSRILKIN